MTENIENSTTETRTYSSGCRRPDFNWSEKHIDKWKDYLIKSQEEIVTENGQYPHRLQSTGHIMTIDAIRKLCCLAKFAVRVGRKNGKQTDKMLIEFLRMHADELEGKSR